jgi:hypothetical protein
MNILKKSLIGVTLLGVIAGSAISFSVGASASSVAPNITPLKAEQVLGYLGYLPVSFKPTSGTLSSKNTAQGGTFSWRWKFPVALMREWGLGDINPIVKGGLMSFERINNIASTTTLTSGLAEDLLNAAAQDKKDPQSYNYVYVSTTLPERVYLYVNGRLTFSTLANTGVSSAPTQLGTFQVYLRYVVTTMSGTYPDGGHYYDPGIPWVSYFNGGDALHGFIRASYGFPQSLGCVEMPFSNAKKLWPYTPIGTVVTVAAALP